ncbi:MAG: flippase [Chloroflexi bacterium]|nr:MAG: flippase [Chloroflexota bacterium]
MNTFVKVVARNSLVTLVSRLLVKVISFGFTIWIARTLGHEDFGRYALIWSFVTIFATFSDWGLGMYTIRELAKGNAENNHLAANVITFRLLLAGVTVLLILGAAQFTAYSSQRISHIILASTILFLYAVQDPLDSVLQANERVDISSLLRITGQLIFVGLGTLFLLAGWGITGLILAALCNVLVTTVLSWQTIRQKLGGLQWKIRPRLWLKLFTVAVPFGVIGFSLNWSQKIDTVVLSLYHTDTMIGWYNAAYSLILGVTIISNSLNVALFPSMSKENSLDNVATQKITARIFKYLFIASLPEAVGLIATRQQVINILYGPEFAPAVVPLAILAWSVPLLFVSEFLRYRALVMHRENEAAASILIAALVNIILNILFIPRYGLVAAATTTVITEALLVVLYLQKLKAEIPARIVVAEFWKPAAASALMLVIFILAAHLLLWAIVLGGLTYIGVLLLLGGLGLEEKALLQKFFKRLFPAVSHQL